MDKMHQNENTTPRIQEATENTNFIEPKQEYKLDMKPKMIYMTNSKIMTPDSKNQDFMLKNQDFIEVL